MTRTERVTSCVAAAGNGILGVAWLLQADRLPIAPWIALAHGAGLMLPWLLAHWDRSLSGRGAQALRVFKAVYPIALVMLFWTELGRLHGPMVGSIADAAVSRLDLAVFGRHWHVEWMAALPLPWLSEVMHLVYLLYFPAVFGTALVLAFRNCREAQRDVLLRLLVTYTGCFVIYLVFPVVGPGMPVLPEVAHGFFYSISHSGKAAGDSLGTAFPSSHVAGAVTIAFAAARWFSRPVARGYLLLAALVALATVYTRNHYAIDAVAGALWAILLQVAVVPLLLQGRKPLVSVPQLAPQWWAVETTGSRP